jgi:hypothetical protein
MDEVARLLTLLALAGGALTLVGGAFAFFLDETRRIRRTLAEGLGAAPQPMLVARGRGAGIGFDLTRSLVAVAWDKGGWRLTYRLDEMVGVELILDRRVAARAFRGEPRRPLDELAEPEERVRLRFVFDDPGHPEFLLDLWLAGDEGRRGRLEAHEAVAEANRWMARMEALLRRPGVAPAKAAVAAPARSAAPAAPLLDDPPFEDDPEDAIT